MFGPVSLLHQRQGFLGPGQPAFLGNDAPTQYRMLQALGLARIGMAEVPPLDIPVQLQALAVQLDQALQLPAGAQRAEHCLGAQLDQQCLVGIVRAARLGNPAAKFLRLSSQYMVGLLA